MRKLVVPALKAIAALTVLSGLIQMIRPQWILAIVGAVSTPTSQHFFGIVGMFMVLFGGLLWQALAADRPQRLPLFWCGLQKLGASIAVGLGVANELFSWFAMTVAGFDLFSGVLILAYWWVVRDSNAPPA